MIWPDHLEERGRGNIYRVVLHFFCGETSQRVQTAIDLIDWILEHLKGNDHAG